VNRSLFQSSPFRSAYGIQPMRRPLMGQEGFLEDLTGDLAPLMADLDSWIMKLPVDVAGNYAKRRDECMAKSTFSQYKCLYDLFQDIKREYRDDGEPVNPVVKPTPPPPPASSLPLLPIALGAVGLGAILYIAFGR